MSNVTTCARLFGCRNWGGNGRWQSHCDATRTLCSLGHPCWCNCQGVSRGWPLSCLGHLANMHAHTLHCIGTLDLALRGFFSGFQAVCSSDAGSPFISVDWLLSMHACPCNCMLWECCILKQIVRGMKLPKLVRSVTSGLAKCTHYARVTPVWN